MTTRIEIVMTQDILYGLVNQRVPLSSVAPQRHELYATVTDPELWRQSVAHWLMHGSNPTNVLGQLDFYRNGSPLTCRAFNGGSGRRGSETRPPADPFDELIAEYNQKPRRRIR